MAEQKPDAAKPDAPARTRTKATEETPGAPAVFISEGIRGELEFHGKAVDPATGNKLEMDEDGKITVTDRITGKATTL